MSSVKTSYCKLFAFYLVFQLFCSSDVLPKMLDIDETTDVFDRSVFGENDLWHNLYQQCGRRSSYGCVQESLTSYLESTLSSDFVTDTVSFRHNGNNYTDICARVKKDSPGDFNERAERKLEFGGEDGFSEFVEKVEEVEKMKEDNVRKGKDYKMTESNKKKNSSLPEALEVQNSDSTPGGVKNIGDVTDMMYDRGLKYLMTHDVQLSIPSFVFGGGKVQISPRGFDVDGGALVKLNVVPDQPQQQGRLFFKQIKKLFKKKLMSSMLAAMLIIKLLKLKLMFFLPVLLGVGTAKKILLKVLLFVFPALAHLFKLCSYYHHKHAKYHHHHHQIAHHHHHIPVPIYTPVHSEHTAPGELPAPYPSSYDATGPGVYHSRTEAPGSLADLAAWGLGEYPSAWDNNLPPATDPPRYNYPTRPHQVAPTQQYATTADLKRLYAAAVSGAGAGGGVSKTQQYSQALTSRLQALTPRPAPAAASAMYDPFYSPMLQRLDGVFGSLGVTEEGCRERVVCSMYKNPARFSPHSNLISAELSRDPSELQKPLTANSAVVRFYRYLQAARDGQERKDCPRLYPACSITTE